MILIRVQATRNTANICWDPKVSGGLIQTGAHGIPVRTDKPKYLSFFYECEWVCRSATISASSLGLTAETDIQQIVDEIVPKLLIEWLSYFRAVGHESYFSMKANIAIRVKDARENITQYTSRIENQSFVIPRACELCFGEPVCRHLSLFLLTETMVYLNSTVVTIFCSRSFHTCTESCN